MELLAKGSEGHRGVKPTASMRLITVTQGQFFLRLDVKPNRWNLLRRNLATAVAVLPEMRLHVEPEGRKSLEESARGIAF